MDITLSKNNNLENIITTALKIPGIKVNRTEFLLDTFSKYLKSDEDRNLLLTQGPKALGLDKKTVDKIAKSIINSRVVLSSGASFLAGLPGGLAITATIPADLIQFFSIAIRLSQELAYIYGMSDIYKDKVEDDVKNELILYIGSMFGVAGTNEAIRILSSRISTQVVKQLPKKALTKGVIYPVAKSVCKVLGVKLTKDTFAKGVSKIVPVIGGIVSGGITFISMKPMGNRLKDTLSIALFDYSEEEFKNDLEQFNIDSTILDAEYIAVDNASYCENTSNYSSDGVIDEIKRAKELYDLAIITEQEFIAIKTKLIEKLEE